MKTNEEKLFLVLLLVLAFLILGLFLYRSGKKEVLPPPPPPVLIETPLPTRYEFKEELKNDTVITFRIQRGDALKSAKFRNKSNAVVIYETEKGDKFQIICYQKQDWNPLPQDDELIFSNGKILSVKFITSKKSF